MGDLSVYMAKADKTFGWHPLSAHSADVAAVLERLLRDDSHIARRVRRLAPNVDWDAFRAALVYLAFIHDFGKVNSKFQAGLLKLLQGGPRMTLGHVKIVFDTLRSTQHSQLGDEIGRVFTGLLSPLGTDNERAEALFLVFLAHHGKPYRLDGNEPVGTLNLEVLWGQAVGKGRRPPLQEIQRLAKLGLEKSGLEQLATPVVLPKDPELTHLLAGLITLSDWVGSTPSAFPFTPSAEDDFDAYWETARERADEACRSIGLIASREVVTPPAGTIYQTLFPQVFGAGSGNQPTNLQSESARRPGREGGELRLIEASTGSGKTEAALAHFAQLRATGEVGGLMFALPTRATAQAMKERIEGLLDEFYVTDRPSVTLAVGGAVPRSQGAEGPLGERPVFPSGESDLDDDLISWATDHHKKFLAGEIVVGTIDQAMLAVLAVKHAHLRLAALSRHLLVIDEVHSHDTYMTRVLKELLEFHLSIGGHALLMSATLSSAARSTLVSVDAPCLEEALAVPYPTLAIAEAGRGWTNLEVAQEGESKTVSWELCSEGSAIEAAKVAAEAGARVCFIRNTVMSAQATVATLTAEAPHLLWSPTGSDHKPAYHSRFTPPDRAVLDSAVTASFGKGSPGGGAILVATQVIEQSLDVDFDLVISDLAPIELLLQRIGRLHRHRTRDALRPPDYAEPRFMIVGPDSAFEPDRTAPRDNGWGTVYRNMIALELTRRAVASSSTIQLPRDYRPLIESVYDQETVDRFVRSEGWTDEQIRLEGTDQAHEFHARGSLLSLSDDYSCNATRYGSEIRIRTRLGDESLEVKLSPPARCWYAHGGSAPSVTIPLRVARRSQLEDLSDPLAEGQIAEDGTSRYQLGDLSLSYDHSGWSWPT